MDIAGSAAADSRLVKLGAIEYRVGELTPAEWLPVQAWIKAHAPGPLSALGLPDFAALPKVVRDEVIALALRQAWTAWPPRIGSREWFIALDLPGGHAEMFLAVLRKHQPSITREGAASIAAATEFEEIPAMVCAALGLADPAYSAPSETATAGVRAGAERPTSSPVPPDAIPNGG